MTRVTERPAALVARRKSLRRHQMQGIVAYQPRPFSGTTELAGRRFQSSCQRIPIEMNDPLRLAAPDLHCKALHRHHEFQGLHPFDCDPHRVLARQIIQFGMILAADRLLPLLLARPARVAVRKQRQAACRLAMQIVMVRLEQLLIAAEPPA